MPSAPPKMQAVRRFVASSLATWRGEDPDGVRRRAIGIALTLLIELLIVLAIFSLGRTGSGPRSKGSDLSAFNLSPSPSSTDKAESKAAPAATAKAQAVPPPPIPPQLFPAPNRVVAPPPAPYVKVTSDEFKAMDIDGFARTEGDAGAAGSSAGAAGAATFGPGEGPGGEPIYPVAWYREPTDAEIQPYLREAKRVPRGAWAELACRMIDDYRVENCRQLRESHPGSGVARALRLASWQFRVRPPRVGGKILLGTWVRIRFDFSKVAAAPEEPTLPGASEGN